MPTVLADAATTIGFTDVKPVVDALTAQISVNTIISVVAAVVGVTIGIVFMWWAVRKATRAIFSAFRGGKQSV